MGNGTPADQSTQELPPWRGLGRCPLCWPSLGTYLIRGVCSRL